MYNKMQMFNLALGLAILKVFLYSTDSYVLSVRKLANNFLCLEY